MSVETVTSTFLEKLRPRKPKVHCNDNPHNRALIASMAQLHEAFRPTPWLFNEHLQLVALTARMRANAHPYCRTEPLIMADGGHTALVWRGYGLPETTPTIVVLPTIAGSALSMAELVDDLHSASGFRVVLCLRRGHDDLPLTTPRLNIFGSTDDLREQLACIRRRFPDSALYGVGSSAGSGLLVRYLGEEGEAALFEAAFAYCPGYDIDAVFDRTHPFYSRYMTRSLVRQFITRHEDKLAHLKTVAKLRSAESLSELHRSLYELAGYDSYEAYTAASNPMRVFDAMRRPIMILNSEDDPVCRIENVEPYLETIARMPNTILVTTDRGSHCAHYQGWSAQSWAGRLMGSYFLSIRGVGS